MATAIQSQAGSIHQIVRLLQIGIVLEEIAEARAAKHARAAEDIDSDVRAFLESSASDSARHRALVKELVEQLDEETVSFDRTERLVEEQYGADQNFDSVLYDQLCSEETAYKLYDDLIGVVEQSGPEFDADSEHLLSVLETLRAEEAEGAKEVLELMKAKS